MSTVFCTCARTCFVGGRLHLLLSYRFEIIFGEGVVLLLVLAVDKSLLGQLELEQGGRGLVLQGNIVSARRSLIE